MLVSGYQAHGAMRYAPKVWIGRKLRSVQTNCYIRISFRSVALLSIANLAASLPLFRGGTIACQQHNFREAKR
jgi:hypothetical protein